MTGPTLADAQRVLAALPDPWDQLLGLLLETGGRYSEIAALTWECISFSESYALLAIKPHRLPNGSEYKPKRPASVRSLRVALERAPGRLQNRREPKCGSSLVWWPERAAPVQARTANWQLARACSRLGVARFSTHHLRHLRITQALAAGADPNSVRAAVGHRSLGTTIGYLRDVPVQGALPDLEAGAVPNPVAAQYLAFGARAKNWKGTT